MAKAQKEEAWLATLSEAEMEQLSKAYVKEKEKAEREHQRVRFQLVRYKESVKASNGVRAEARRRFMNEAQYMKFAQSDDGGNYTKLQAEAKWTEMLGDIGVDKLGEGKNLRCAVKVYDDLVDYSDVGSERAIEQEARLSAKMSEKEMERKVNAMVLSNHDKSNFQLGGVANLSQGMASQVFDSEGSGGFSSTVLPGQKLQDLMPSTGKKRKLVAGTEEEAEDAASSEEPADAPGSAEKPEETKEKTKWFDAAASVAKAKRQLKELVDKFHSRMKIQVSSMQEQIDLSRASTHEAPVETKIVNTRLQALQIIAHGTADEFAVYCCKMAQLLGDSLISEHFDRLLADDCLGCFIDRL